MRVEYLKDKLRWAINIAEKMTGKNLSLPTLGQVMLEADQHVLKVKATNLDVGVELLLPAKVVEIGRVMVDGSVLSNFLANLYRGERVVLETTSQNLIVSSDNTSSVIKTYPIDDFPDIPRLNNDDNYSVTISSSQLVSGLKSVSYAASLSDIKPEIASIYLYQDQGSGDLVFVSTDSFRLAEKRLNLGVDNQSAKPPSLIIPARNVVEIIRAMDGLDELVKVSWDGNQVAFVTDKIYLVSRLVGGTFPDYRQIMPTNNQTKAIMTKTDLLNTLKLSNIFADKLNQVHLKIAVKDNLFEINSRHGDVGENTTKLSATLSGEDVEIGFNIRYLLDCFQSINTEKVSLSFNSHNRPIVVAGVGDSSFTYLIMPLNR